MNVLDLFSGIGGFSLGLERAGMRTVAFCEIDPYCRRVLAKHWPSVPAYDDVLSLTADRLKADGIAADVICGGFPCQDISVAGFGAGLAGERSGLWFEYARLIGELRPRYVIVENVTGLLSRGLDVVLGNMAALGYDAEWHCIPASSVGAHHRRDRVWVVANPRGQRVFELARRDNLPDIERADTEAQQGRHHEPSRAPAVRSDGALAHANQGNAQGIVAQCDDPQDWCQPLIRPARLCDGAGRDLEWAPEPDVGRVAHGVPNRVDRLKALGNSVVPQITEIIGRAIMKAHTHSSA
jgi:DNA (cytosine-5)-methyltransferase 1